jgi:hypothetical protein
MAAGLQGAVLSSADVRNWKAGLVPVAGHAPIYHPLTAVGSDGSLKELDSKEEERLFTINTLKLADGQEYTVDEKTVDDDLLGSWGNPKNVPYGVPVKIYTLNVKAMFLDEGDSLFRNAPAGTSFAVFPTNSGPGITTTRLKSPNEPNRVYTIDEFIHEPPSFPT